ncbi:BRCA1-associated RING domain protein 1 isoform X2 [Ziziphus jujuba]|uniref:RING-type E3 ubiquitin transferase BRCA1 n=2 Tax=Ziziphus jujuba TaxID=326968 RepID=A0A6P4A6N7_ZIZJJ|nr:BRCA1-associated RING domain protein 1 isoform X2 [Ziziphus jujuba]KAH7517420.1 hypothetical protein FEM48_Zijuj09G0061600 [Ziziphus jujuba var. spinosa]
MGDSNGRLLLNPWVLNFEKLGLELKCPLCLNFLNRPMLLPCNHIFCNRCMPCSTQFGAVCPVCQARYADGDLRHVPFMENMATIYKCLEATFCATLFQPTPADGGRGLGQSPVSINIKFDDKIRKESLANARGKNSRSEQSKQIHGPFVKDGIDKNDRVGKHSMPMDIRGQNIEMTGKKGTKFNGAMNSHSQSSRSHIRTGGNEECGTMEIEMNQMGQSSPDSPPSLDDAKGSDDCIINQCSERSSENWLVKRPRESDGNEIGQLRNESSASENDSHLGDVMRAKKLNYGPAELGISSAEDIQAISQSRSSMTDSDNSICAFCQSSKISEVSGPMLHYSSGNLVVGDEATHPDVIHVHSACINWAPQVYYVGETVKNLKAEVARGAKLKCSRCGLKGAALGCYVRSCRRSYHVTCAMEISKCRFDHEDFLMLCPAHSSVRFPNEKLKSRKHISKDHALSAQMSCLLAKNWLSSPNGEKKWVLCGSALSTKEKILLVKFGKMTGATVSKSWNPNVTHMIAATDENGACTRTLKVLMAILNGRWILKFDWIKACMEAMHHVDEEPYEVGLDNYGCCDGPKTGRLRALDNAPKLFNGLNFYFAGDFVLSYKEDIKDLVRAAGGTVLPSMEEVVAQSCNESSKTLVVYNIDPPEGCKLGEEVSILWQRLSEAADIANKTGSQVIGHTWLLESIAGCKLQSIVTGLK